MHIFKNVGSTIWEHLIGAKDTKAAREDLMEMDRMMDLWPQTIGERTILPKAPWILSPREQTIVKRMIASFRTPTGHMRCPKGVFTGDNKLSGLKSHDWHKFLHVQNFIRNLM